MSSHREAPEISKDPAVDNTDVYAFVSPDRPDYVTLIANFNPFQKPDGGPNFYEFDQNALYEIHISNKGDAQPDITYQFRFQTVIRNSATFLYNTGPISHVADKTWNRPQYYSLTRVLRNGSSTVLTSDRITAPVNIGVRSTPNYAALAAEAVHGFGGGRQVFAGPRADPFFVDLGSVFDLAGLRPFNSAHLIKENVVPGVNGLQGLNVSTLAIQIPKSDLTRDGKLPTDPMAPGSVIGVWATASRQRSRIYDSTGGQSVFSGPFVQVSRLGFPLFNELLVPMGRKDFWNTQPPNKDSQFASGVTKPELAGLLPALYPGVFPHLAAYTKPRADLEAIILTGIPKGIIAGFQNNTGTVLADMLRLNMAIPPAKKPNALGLVANDAAGFPNGRRIFDDVVAVELRAVAGALIPLVDKSYQPDAAAGQLTDGTSNTNPPYLGQFPYAGTPAGGYQTVEAVPHT
ncbi:MAG TPA: DUF4331 domain-containing protein [Frankiaceae bacterium]|nr:DUF4331 domain-containing protein [Frankiaceae bacterium]